MVLDCLHSVFSGGERLRIDGFRLESADNTEAMLASTDPKVYTSAASIGTGSRRSSGTVGFYGSKKRTRF